MANNKTQWRQTQPLLGSGEAKDAKMKKVNSHDDDKKKSSKNKSYKAMGTLVDKTKKKAFKDANEYQQELKMRASQKSAMSSNAPSLQKQNSLTRKIERTHEEKARSMASQKCDAGLEEYVMGSMSE